MHLLTNSNLLRLDSDESSYISYNSRGLPTSITKPDPDGAGALTSPVTTLAYDSYGRLTTLTNPDSSTQTFAYNTADQLLTNTRSLTLNQLSPLFKLQITKQQRPQMQELICAMQ